MRRGLTQNMPQNAVVAGTRCKTCDAAPGQPCKKAGKVIRKVHPQRIKDHDARKRSGKLSEAVARFRGLDEAITDPELKHYSRRKWGKMQAKHKISGSMGSGEAQRHRENAKKTNKCSQRGGKMVFGRCWFPKGGKS